MEFDLVAHMLKGFVYFLILSHFNYTLREILDNPRISILEC